MSASATAEVAPPALGSVHLFVAAVARGDRRGAAACFTRDGCLITPDGTAVHGRPDVGAIVAQLIARRTEIAVEQLTLREAGDVALVAGRFTMRFDGPEGLRLVQPCAPVITLRRVEESWKIAILAPWASFV
jgi:ketosteroid isomerase-like protein